MGNTKIKNDRVKAYVGVDVGSSYTRTLTAAPANHHDITEPGKFPKSDCKK